jgi:hypothetical protein
MNFKIHINNSIVDIECELNRFREEEFIHIYMRALDLSTASVDTVAFSMGYGLSVILEQLVDPNGNKSVIAFNDPRLPPLCTAFNLQSNFDEVHTMMLTNISLAHAVRDLIEAITRPHVSLVNCARAMDRLKHLIARSGSKDTSAWQQMREALQIDLSYLKFITDHSAGPRHGRPDHVPGTITTNVTTRAWTIMNRYFEYRKRGQAQLPTAEFPLLRD